MAQINPANYQMLMNTQAPAPQHRNIQIPVINLQAVPNKQILRTTPNVTNINMLRTSIANQIAPLTSNAMSPLSLNIGSPMYSLPSSPNTPSYSPAMSPAQRDRIYSAYSTPQSLSPVGRYQQSPRSQLVSPTGVMQGGDPYLNNKMQPSPTYLQSELLLDSTLTTDFWTEPELQGTTDLLTAFDDVKLV